MAEIGWSRTAALEIIAASFCLAVAVEFVCWLICYRTAAFKRVKAEVDVTHKKLEALKNGQAALSKDGEKKKKKLEDSLKACTAEMFWLNGRVLLVNAVVLFAAYRIFSAQYKGVIVGKLPFEPFSFVQRLSHGGLEDSDMTNCAAMFIYVLCQTSLRPNIQKVLGLGPTRKFLKQTSMQSMVEKQQ